MKEPRILIVDDDPDILMMIAMYFENAGADVTTSDRAPDALEMLCSDLKTESPFDMLIIDIRMPEMDGHELSRRVRAAGFEGAVIAFTASPSIEGKTESENSGITAYLSKAALESKQVKALLKEHCN